MSFPYFGLRTPETSGDPRRSPPYKEIWPCEGGSYRFVPGFVVIRFSFSINKSRQVIMVVSHNDQTLKEDYDD